MAAGRHRREARSYRSKKVLGSAYISAGLLLDDRLPADVLIAASGLVNTPTDVSRGRSRARRPSPGSPRGWHRHRPRVETSRRSRQRQGKAFPRVSILKHDGEHNSCHRLDNFWLCTHRRCQAILRHDPALAFVILVAPINRSLSKVRRTGKQAPATHPPASPQPEPLSDICVSPHHGSFRSPAPIRSGEAGEKWLNPPASPTARLQRCPKRAEMIT